MNKHTEWTDITWRWQDYGQLDGDTLYRVMQARVAVFVVEQNCPYQELDGLDPDCRHLCGYSNGQLAAYLRLVPPAAERPYPAIGRVLTLAPWRGSGLGRVLMAEGLAEATRCHSGQPVKVAAQQHLAGFYQSMGFRGVGETYLEDGIPHIDMLRQPA